MFSSEQDARRFFSEVRCGACLTLTVITLCCPCIGLPVWCFVGSLLLFMFAKKRLVDDVQFQQRAEERYEEVLEEAKSTIEKFESTKKVEKMNKDGRAMRIEVRYIDKQYPLEEVEKCFSNYGPIKKIEEQTFSSARIHGIISITFKHSPSVGFVHDEGSIYRTLGSSPWFRPQVKRVDHCFDDDGNVVYKEEYKNREKEQEEDEHEEQFEDEVDEEDNNVDKEEEDNEE